MNKQQDKQIEKLSKEIEEWKGKYLRALADYQNLEKRVQAERNEEIRFAAKNLILKILPVIDILEKADQALNNQGLHLAVGQLKDVLRNEQVERMETLGMKFNPQMMECVEVMSSNKDGIVVEEAREGYTMFGKVIRIAQVKVGKKEIDQKAQEQAKQELQKGDYM